MKNDIRILVYYFDEDGIIEEDEYTGFLSIKEAMAFTKKLKNQYKGSLSSVEIIQNGKLYYRDSI